MLARFGEPLPARGRHPDGRPARAAPRTSRRSCARSTRPACAVESLDLVQPTLDDVFVEKTGRHLEGAEEQPAAAGDGPGVSAGAAAPPLGARLVAETARGRGARAPLGDAGLPPAAVPRADHRLPVAVPGRQHRRRRARRRPAAVPAGARLPRLPARRGDAAVDDARRASAPRSRSRSTSRSASSTGWSRRRSRAASFVLGRLVATGVLGADRRRSGSSRRAGLRRAHRGRRRRARWS